MEALRALSPTDPSVGDSSYSIKQRRKVRPTLVEAGEDRYVDHIVNPCWVYHLQSKQDTLQRAAMLVLQGYCIKEQTSLYIYSLKVCGLLLEVTLISLQSINSSKLEFP